MLIVTQDILRVNTETYNPPNYVTPPVQENADLSFLEGQERRQELSGLVDSAISRRTDPSQIVTLEFKAGGMTAKRNNLTITPPPPESRRGVVTGFSMRSRRRLRDRLIEIDWRDLIPAKGRSRKAVFATVTYPNEYNGDWQSWKRDLAALQKRLDRHYGVTGAMWRLEFQKRGAPHFHILLIFSHDIDVKRFREWLSLAWFEIVGSGDPFHLKAGTNVRGLYGPVGRLMHYLAKYLAKPWEGERETGRMWGIWGSLPESDVLTVTLDWRGWVEFTRRLRKWGKKSRYLRTRNANAKGFLIFGDLRQLLRGLEIDDRGMSYVTGTGT